MSGDLNTVPDRKQKRCVPTKLQDFMKWFPLTQHDGPDSSKIKRNGPVFIYLEFLRWHLLKTSIAAQGKLQRLVSYCW